MLRHAKSSWDDPSLDDRERPLSRRGVRAAARMAAVLAGAARPPSLALCSSARRTRETLAAVLVQLPLRCEIEDALYQADAAVLLARLARVGDAEPGVLLVGHNPGLHDLATALAGSGSREQLRRLAERLPTGALAEFELARPWREIAPGCARLVALTVPRELA